MRVIVYVLYKKKKYTFRKIHVEIHVHDIEIILFQEVYKFADTFLAEIIAPTIITRAHKGVHNNRVATFNLFGRR